MWQNSKTQSVTKLKNSKFWEKKLKSSKCDKTKKFQILQNQKTQNVTKLKKIKFLQNSTTQTWRRKKLKKSKCDKKNVIVTKLISLNCEKKKKKSETKIVTTLNN